MSAVRLAPQTPGGGCLAPQTPGGSSPRLERQHEGLLAVSRSVSQTVCDSIDPGLFTERSSERDQLNIYYGRSMLAAEQRDH